MTNRYQIQFEKDKTFLKAFLAGRNYNTALKSLGWIERETQGKFRKDGVMPELHHMIRLALAATQLGLPSDVPQNYTTSRSNHPSISLEEKVVTALLLHDAVEDDVNENLGHIEIAKICSSGIIAEAVMIMSKKVKGKKKSQEEYISQLSMNLIAALAKGLDRNDNLEHMIGVFPLDKMKSYVQEAKRDHYPMLKKASKNFPEHLRVFQLIMYRMKSIIKQLDEYIKLAEETELLREFNKNSTIPPGLISREEVIQKVLNIFDGVSPDHFELLKRKLNDEFEIESIKRSDVTESMNDIDEQTSQQMTSTGFFTSYKRSL